MTDKKLLQTLNRKLHPKPPFWFMRQAGRYLPEYLETRASCGGFLDLCFNPEKAAEVTLQPIRRFNMDAAILFSDILVIPMALGQPLRFEKGEGPKLPPISSLQEVQALEYDPEKLNPIYQTVTLLKQKLPQDKTLIGFSGSPWTLACYMLQGGGSKDFATARKFGHQQPQAFAQLLEKIEAATLDYVSKQVDAGAEVIQFFDSWSGVCSAAEFDAWVVAPTRRLVSALKKRYPHLPIIGFPRLAGIGYQRYVMQTGIDAVGLDVQITPKWAKSHLSQHVVLQGNLDPILLASDAKGAVDEAKRLVDAYADTPFIFNLGHGFIPETPVSHVEKLVEFLSA